MSRQVAAKRQGKELIGGKAKRKNHHQSELVHHVKLSELHYNRDSVWRN